MEYWLLLLFVKHNHMVKSMDGYAIFAGVFVDDDGPPLAKALGTIASNQDFPEVLHCYSEEFRQGVFTRAVVYW